MKQLGIHAGRLAPLAAHLGVIAPFGRVTRPHLVEFGHRPSHWDWPRIFHAPQYIAMADLYPVVLRPERRDVLKIGISST